MLPQSCVSLPKWCSFHQSSLSSPFAFAAVFPLHHLQSDEVLDTLTNHSKDIKKTFCNWQLFTITGKHDFDFFSVYSITWLKLWRFGRARKTDGIKAIAERFVLAVLIKFFQSMLSALYQQETEHC